MPDRASSYHRPTSIEDIANYHRDASSALTLYFSDTTLPHYPTRFFNYLPQDIRQALHQRLDETEIRSSLILLAYLEATFRVDYAERCSGRKRKRDALSKAFWTLFQQQGERVHFEDEILETWRTVHSDKAKIIGELRGAFKFRHWLAHGRYWSPKLGRKYDYATIYQLATAVITDFPFYRP